MQGKETEGRPLKVVHLATTNFGGAGKAAYRLHLGLRASGIDSTMLVANRKGDDPTVRTIPSGVSGCLVECPPQYPQNLPYLQRVWEHWKGRVAPYSPVPQMEIFTDDYSEIRLGCSREIREADIVNLHWVPGVVNWLDAAVALKGKKVVWTMHDMNPFTGGCHYCADCTRYRLSCGSCPLLRSNDEGDISRSNWLSKNYAFQRLDLHPVAPSRWLARSASASGLMSPLQTRVIPYGFPDLFRPHPGREELRAGYGVPAGAKVLLFGAESLLNQRKGFSYLLRALQMTRSKGIVLAVFGQLPDKVQLSLGLPVIKLGFVEDESTLASVYSMADLFVIPSLEDNLPNTAAEAMLCGVPVAGFDTGGIPDLVAHRETGYLAPARDCRALAEGIEWCLFSESAAGLGERARRKADADYRLETQASRYRALYRELLAEADTASSPLPVKLHFPGAEGTGHGLQPHASPEAPLQEEGAPESAQAGMPRRTVRRRYLVSAVVSTYNAERFLRGKLEDLEAQSIAEDLEIIVVDSASTQNEHVIVAEFQKRYPNIRYLRSPRRETVYQAWNRGIRMATGEFVANANTDDRLRRDAYQRLVEALRGNPDCVLAYPDMLITAEQNGTFDHHQRLGYRDWPPYDPLLLLDDCCVGPFPLWRRSLHEEIGYFDERYRSAADYDFWLRAALRHPLFHLPEFLGLYYLNEESLSKKGELPAAEYLHVQKSHRPRFAALIPSPRKPEREEEEEFRKLLLGAAQGGPEELGRVQRFMEAKRRWPEAHFELGEFCRRTGQTALARKHLEKAATLEPESLRYRGKLQAFLTAGLLQPLQQYRAAAEADGGDLEAHLCAGMISVLMELPEAALQHYRSALAIDPHCAVARENVSAIAGSPAAGG